MLKLTVLSHDEFETENLRDGAITKVFTFYTVLDSVSFRVTINWEVGYTKQAISVVERWTPVGWKFVLDRHKLEIPSIANTTVQPPALDDELWTPVLNKIVNLAYEVTEQERSNKLFVRDWE